MGMDWITIGYAITISAGGVFGYVKAGSIGSLAAGLAFGLFMAYGAYQTSQDPNNYGLSLVASSILGIIMGIRFYNSGKFMPAGLVMCLSLLMVIRFAARALSGTR